MDNKYIARPCKNCKDNECCFKGHENNFEICEDYTVTNGDMIKVMFPNCEQKEHINNGYFEMYFDGDFGNASYMKVSKDWWNAPFKKGVEE